MPNGFRGEIHFFALFCEKLIKKPCLLIVQNQFHGMFARFDADIAVISAVFAVQSPGNLLVGLDDDAVGLERIDEVCVILLHQQGRNDLIQFQRVFRAFDQGYLEESVIQAYILDQASRLARALWIEIFFKQVFEGARFCRGSREPCGLKYLR